MLIELRKSVPGAMMSALESGRTLTVAWPFQGLIVNCKDGSLVRVINALGLERLSLLVCGACL